MADSGNDDDKEENRNTTETANSSMENTERDLQVIFKKLRVNSEPKRLKRKCRIKCLRRKDGPQSITVNRTLTERKIIKEATFVYKSHDHIKHNKMLKSHNPGLLSLDLQPETKECVSSKDLSNKAPCEVNTVISNQAQRSPEIREFSESCSGQHRRAQCTTVPCGDVNFDDTTPEELAAYFEQLLHIPKPMSAMAEMMYT